MTIQATIDNALSARRLMTQHEKDLADAGEYGSFTLTRTDPADDGACVVCGFKGGSRLRMKGGIYADCCVFCGEEMA